MRSVLGTSLGLVRILGAIRAIRAIRAGDELWASADILGAIRAGDEFGASSLA